MIAERGDEIKDVSNGQIDKIYLKKEQSGAFVMVIFDIFVMLSLPNSSNIDKILRYLYLYHKHNNNNKHNIDNIHNKYNNNTIDYISNFCKIDSATVITEINRKKEDIIDLLI